MSRNGSGVYSLPSGYLATTGNTITATQHNSPFEDLETDMNTARPVVAGGTGASTAADARTNLAVGDKHAYGAVGTPTISFTSDPDTGIYHPASDDSLVVTLGGAAEVTFSTSGTEFANGAKFGGTAAANLLDNITKGTWTPSLTFGGGNTGMLTASTGRYTRIADAVFFSFQVTVNTVGSSTGIARVTLPLTSSNDDTDMRWVSSAELTVAAGLGSGELSVVGDISANDNRVVFRFQDTGGVSNVNEGDFAAGTVLYCSGHYNV